LLDRKEKTVELQTRVHDCSVSLQYLDQIFNDTGHDAETDAATFINATVRGFLIRRRTAKARVGLVRWRTAQLVQLKAATARFLAVQRTKDHAAAEMLGRSMGAMLARVVHAWRAHTTKKLPQRRKYRGKFDAVRIKHIENVQRWHIAAWHEQATGQFSKKHVQRSYAQRKRRAELRLIEQQEQTGVPDGPITEQMVEAEVSREAAEMISEQHYANVLSVGLQDWRGSKELKKARRHYQLVCMRRVLLAWLKLVETTKGSDETWLIEHQTRVKMRIFFRALQEDVYGAWAHYAHTRQEATRRFTYIQKTWFAEVFAIFKHAVLAQHETRDVVMRRLRTALRAQRGVPFRAWHSLMLQDSVWRHAITTFTSHADRRRARAIERACLEEWKAVVFNASAQDTQQLLTSVQDLQAANEQLQAQNLQAVTQAEASVAMGEMKLAEKEKRAAAAEEESRQAQIELQKMKEALIKAEHERDNAAAIANAKAQIGGKKRQELSAPEKVSRSRHMRTW
jgi:hypothetical protein